MKLHGNARTCLHPTSPDREPSQATRLDAHRAKDLRRFQQEGEEGLLDRSSAPGSIPHRTAEDRIAAIAALRRLRLTAAEIAELLAMPLSTVSAILTRIGLGRRAALEPREPVNRYEKARAGELVHIDVKKLGRIARPGHRVTGRVSARGHHRRAFELGWEFVHVAVDDATRLAYVEVLADEKGVTAVGFLRHSAANRRSSASRRLGTTWLGLTSSPRTEARLEGGCVVVELHWPRIWRPIIQWEPSRLRSAPR